MSSLGTKITIVLAVLSGLSLPAVSWAQTTVRLAPGDNLAAAITAAGPGDILELQGGDYGALTIRRAGGQPGLPVTIRSADPADPARLSGMDLREMTHLVLDGLMFNYVYSPGHELNIRPFQVLSTHGLTIRNSIFDGDLADSGSPGEKAFPTGFALRIRSSEDITLDANEIRNFYRGIVVRDSVNVTVKANDLHAIRMDGMNFAQVERVLIEDNLIRDFRRALGSADHADMIQFWTNKTERPSRDITIRNNVLNSGLGWYTQSIFMRNEEVDTGRAGDEMFYKNVLIEGNVIINAQVHGITLGATDGVIIRNNSVLHNARSDGKKDNTNHWTPRVRVSDVARNVRITDNVLHKISGYDSQSDWVVLNNTEVQDRSPDQANHYNDLFVAAQSGDPRDLASFRYRPEGALAGKGRGSGMLDTQGAALSGPAQARSAAALAKGAPVIRTEPDLDIPTRFTFDVSESSADPGPDLAGSTLSWDFGDGNTAEGPKVSHNFARAGIFEVTLHITLPDGTPLSSTARVRPVQPEVIEFDAAKGTITTFVPETPAVLPLSLAPGPIRLGGEHELISIPRQAIAPFFGARSFVLETRLRSSGGPKAAGVVMHIYKTLVVTVSGRGTIDVQFDTETGRTVQISTPPLRILQNEWVDVVLEYSQDEGMLQVWADGSLAAQAQTSGQIRPLEHWGLALGNPFQGQRSFAGEMEKLVLKVGQHDVSAAQ